MPEALEKTMPAAPEASSEIEGSAPGLIAPSRMRRRSLVLAAIVAIPMLFNAITLLPELTVGIPSLNDDAVHFLLVRQANAALERGANPFDFWVPQLELGFPQFMFYQHLPHLAVVLLYHLLFKQVSLLTLFNLVRYLLLVGFPLVVYWSMRTMEFSPVAAAIGAASAALISGNYRYGFEYESYFWTGLGMYTQLWAMNLFFIATACMVRLLEGGRGYLAAILTSSALVMCHLVYAYMFAITVAILFMLEVFREPEPA